LNFYVAPAGVPFLHSAIGNDSLTPGNGEYRIVQQNQWTTTHQTIDTVEQLPKYAQSTADDFTTLPGKDSFTKYARVVVRGQLWWSSDDPSFNDQSGVDGNRKPFDDPIALLNYRLTIYEKTPKQLAFHVELTEVLATTGSTPLERSSPSNKSHHLRPTATGYDRIFWSQVASVDEQVFGLGEQFSFWSLKGQRIPILSRWLPSFVFILYKV